MLARLSGQVLTLALSTLLCFVLLARLPGEPVVVPGDPGANAAALERAPLLILPGESVLQAYGRWAGRALRLELGASLVDGRPVRERLGEVLPRTLLLTLLSLGGAALAALAAALWSTSSRAGWRDRVLGLGCFSLFALPGFWAALLLQGLLAGPRGLQWFPLEGDGGWPRAAGWGAALFHLALPAASLGLGAGAFLAWQLRTALREALEAPHTLAARARGLEGPRLVLRHALRQSVATLVAGLAALLPMVLGGSVVVERIFNIRGLGLLTLEAVERRDAATLMGTISLMVLLTLLTGILAELALRALEPRLSAEAR